jgi:hypothetical protein
MHIYNIITQIIKITIGNDINNIKMIILNILAPITPNGLPSSKPL